MAQQTTVQMLIEYVKKQGFDLEYEMEMSFLDHEREHIENAYEKGAEESWDAEQYYNKTYKEPEEPKPAPEAYYAGWLGLFQNRTDIKLGNK